MKKEDVLRAYEEQKAACIVAFPTLTGSWTYFVQLEKAIDSYFSDVASVSDSVRAVIRGAYVSQTKAALKCKDDEKYGIEYNADVGRIDLTPYWYAWEWLKENLADKIKYTTSETSAQAEGSAGEKIVDAEQPELETVVKDILTARATEATQINDYAESFWQVNSKMDFICLVEDRGNVVKTPNKKAIVEKLYLDCGLLAQSQENGLDIYVPSYLGGDASA
ncbi:hypothetical protein [Phascolarctobacterium succinatutens]|jgi:hypothetical protein|uniref:hypothetical protein n=1 Tax=Phascolarctobacterium succinatutens TaxID=626940 RepID=UPI0026F11C52|nr:hypothetical protein [Phascolarctobacterium succinatutens]